MGVLSKVLDTVKVVAEPFKAAAPIAPFVGAASSLLGGIMRNTASAQAAQKQMDFQREASDTSFQRQVADLKAAGINPMLVSRLGGASTPVGAMPTFLNPGYEAAQSFAGIQTSESSARQAQTAEDVATATIDRIDQEIKNLRTEEQRLARATELIVAQMVTETERGKTQQEVTKQTAQIVAQLVSQNKLLAADVAAVEATNGWGRIVKEMGPAADLVVELFKQVVDVKKMFNLEKFRNRRK
jgi:hypothetical protein